MLESISRCCSLVILRAWSPDKSCKIYTLYKININVIHFVRCWPAFSDAASAVSIRVGTDQRASGGSVHKASQIINHASYVTIPAPNFDVSLIKVSKLLHKCIRRTYWVSPGHMLIKSLYAETTFTNDVTGGSVSLRRCSLVKGVFEPSAGRPSTVDLVQAVTRHHTQGCSITMRSICRIPRRSKKVSLLNKSQSLWRRRFPPTGSAVLTSGFGTTTEGGAASAHLLQVQVNIISEAECNRDYPRRITAQMVCAGVEAGGKDTCQGDSGGPLDHSNQLVGVVSWGAGCARARSPGVYSIVPALRQWLRMEQHQNKRVGGNRRSPKRNPSTSGVVRHDSHFRKSSVIRPGIERCALKGSEQAN
ncbi:hypothetical protein PR048_017129 [Dryococelus australis]|uniref:Peptidase S1 domain-containing protein n=1 Tax=Dryococelus australis TaxID=614101 RepID=A0ABQ9H8N4_9NEOP|nr:hypothetical protein PR048_017129 [Dryococelus australis]